MFIVIQTIFRPRAFVKQFVPADQGPLWQKAANLHKMSLPHQLALKTRGLVYSPMNQRH